MTATAETSPPPETSGGRGSFAVFLDTDLGTHLAVLVAADSTIRHLKSQVAVEHAASFPALGPIAVKSLQVRRKGALYRLSDSMLVQSAFAGVKGGRFLHVQATAGTVHCSQDAAAVDEEQRLREANPGVHAGWRAKDMPATISEVASEVLPHVNNRVLQGDEDNRATHDINATASAGDEDNRAMHDINATAAVADDAPSSFSCQLNKERQQIEAANLDHSTEQSDIAQAEDRRNARKEELLHGNGGTQEEGPVDATEKGLHGNGGTQEEGPVDATKKGKVRKNRDMSEDIHEAGNFSKKKHKKARSVGSFEIQSEDLITERTECQNGDGVSISDQLPMEANTSNGELRDNSFQQEISSSTLQGDSVLRGNASGGGKKKKKNRHQSESSKKGGPVQEITKSCPEAEDLAVCLQNAAAVEDGRELGEGHLGHHVAPSAGELPPAVVSEVMGEVLHHRASAMLQGEDADNAAMTGSGTYKAVPRDVSASSQLDKEKQRSEPGLPSSAEPSNDVVVDQRKANDVLKEHGNLTFVDNVNSTSLVMANEENSMKQSGDSQAEEERHGRNEELVHGDKSQEEVATMANNEEKVNSEEIHARDDLSQEKKKKKKHKKANMVSSVDMPAADPFTGKNESETAEDMIKSDRAFLQGEPVNDSFQQEIPGNVLQGDSALIDNSSVDGKKKKKKRRNAESSREDGPIHEVTKSSPAAVTDDNSLRNIDANGSFPGDVLQGDSILVDNSSVDGKKKKKKKKRHCSESSREGGHTQEVTKSSSTAVTNDSSLRNAEAVTVEATRVNSSPPEEATANEHNELNKDSNAVTTKIIDEILADLSSADNLNKDVGVDMPIEQTPSDENVPSLDRKSRDNAHFQEALPPKYPAEIDYEVPIRTHYHKKSRGKQSNVLSTKLDSSHSLGDVTEQNAGAEFQESDTLRDSNKASDISDGFNSDLVVQTDDNAKTIKRQRKRSSGKHLSDNDGDIGSQGEQANQVAEHKLEGKDATRAAAVERGSVVAGHESTVGKLHRKTKKSAKTELLNQSSTVQGNFHPANEQDSQNSKDGCNDYVLDNSRSHENENAVVATTQASVVYGDAAAIKSTSPNAKLQRRKKSSKTELQMQDSASQQGSDAGLVDYRSEQEMGRPKSYADAIKPNGPLAVHLDSDKINFIDYFSANEVGISNVSVENVRITEGETVKQVKEKKKSKRKSDKSQPPRDSVKAAAEEEKLHHEHQDTDAGNHDLLDSMVLSKRMKHLTDGGNHDLLDSMVLSKRMKHLSKKEHKEKVMKNNGVPLEELEDTTCNSTLEKKLQDRKSDADYLANLPIDKRSTHMSKDGPRKSTSQTTHHESRNAGGSISSGRADQNRKAENNLVKSFSMTPASSESTEDAPHHMNQYRVAVRKVPRRSTGKNIDKSKKENTKISTGAIFTDAMSEGSDDGLDPMSKKPTMESSSDNSSASADSGVSSASSDGKEQALDDDGTMSLSQGSSKKRLHLSSILKSSSSYKKAKLKRTDPDDPESQVDIVFETQPDM